MKKFQVTVNGNTYQVDVEELQGGQTVAAPVMTAPVAAVAAPVAAPAAAPVAAPVSAPAAVAAGANKLDAPMQGKIVGVKVSVGATVKAGDVIVVLEAMKMENEIVSPFTGTVASINVTEGQSVNAGDLLASIN
ncbi:MAG: acetyl-CoA carboxylase biotin carboxyl carrier protein subunit [Firmicutes bacterium HGW-Firmicutes-1]|nr:MAG: acetyl-CoA carboxylase biotin carboxyl carrier protein subunit [Firmicutes bacterium HGW-Firmicutes-1]